MNLMMMHVNSNKPYNHSTFCRNRCIVISQGKMETLLGNTSYCVFFLKDILSEMKIRNQPVQELRANQGRLKRSITIALHGTMSQNAFHSNGTTLPNKFVNEQIQVAANSRILSQSHIFHSFAHYLCNNYLLNT